VLFPYLPRHYTEYINDFGTMMPGVGYTNTPGNGARHDLWDGKGINPSTDLAVLIERYLEVYDQGLRRKIMVENARELYGARLGH
jgi:hypothetical protein